MSRRACRGRDPPYAVVDGRLLGNATVAVTGRGPSGSPSAATRTRRARAVGHVSQDRRRQLACSGMIRRTSPIKRRQHARQVRPDREERPLSLEPARDQRPRHRLQRGLQQQGRRHDRGVRSVQKNGATDLVVTADELEASRRPAKKIAAKKTPPRRPLRRADTAQPLRPRVPPVEVPAQPPTLSGVAIPAFGYNGAQRGPFGPVASRSVGTNASGRGHTRPAGRRGSRRGSFSSTSPAERYSAFSFLDKVPPALGRVVLARGAVWGAQRANPVYGARYRHLTRRDTNKLTRPRPRQRSPRRSCVTCTP